jgi:hypothetical protein
VPAEDFVFLKYDFETFWARRNLILMNVQQIGAFGIEFCMEDLYGNYNLELTQVENSTAIHVHLTSEGECSPSKYTEYMANASYPKSEGGVSLKNLYLYMSNAPEEEHKASLPDSLGAAMFREAMLMFSFIHYVDILPDEVRDEAPSEDDLVMRMKLDVKRKSGLPATDYKNYVYEFYRIDDTRVRVAIHAVYENGDVASDTVSDFYISTYTFKKIVNTFVGILNAQIIDLTEDYPKYDGKKLRFKGIVALDASLPTGHFAIGRHIMTCCADDIAYRGVVAKGMCGVKLQTRDWVIVEGKINEEFSKLYGGRGPVLTVTKIEKAEKPKEEVATFY